MTRTPSPGRLELLPVAGLPEVGAGDDLIALLDVAVRAAGGLRDGDVLCVSAKIVSKAAGLRIDPRDKDAAISAASVREVARRRHGDSVTRVVQLPHGPVMAAAGIDASNSPGGLLLLPPDPDAAAERLRAGLAARTGARLGVIVTDTSSRVWRQGVGDLALGAAGVRALEDLRGSADAQGRRMSVTVRALADEIAAAADLVKGKASGAPAAIVRGLAGAVAEPARAVPAAALSRTGPDDWFRRPSLESVWQALGLAADAEPIAAMEPEPVPERVARAIEVALAPRTGTPPAHLPRVTGPVEGALRVHPAARGADALVAAATVAERLRTALGAEAIADAHETLVSLRVELVPRTEDPEEQR